MLYPGTDCVEHRQGYGILPGSGAFSLRLTRGGPHEAAADVRHFVDEVVDQVALGTSEGVGGASPPDAPHDAGRGAASVASSCDPIPKIPLSRR